MTRQIRGNKQIGPAGLKPHTIATESLSETVRFSPLQLRFLEEQFPERVLGPDTPEEKLRHYFGQRSVVAAVRAKVRL